MSIPNLTLPRLQKLMASAIMRPLTASERMQKEWNGKKTGQIASTFIKPNARLTSFDRLEIYNRQYWFRVLGCFYDDFPGLRAVLGDKKFEKLAQVYLIKNPSRSFTLRNLGDRLESFLKKEPQWVRPHQKLAMDMVRFEWAQVETFDDEARSVLKKSFFLNKDPAKLKLGLQPYIRLLELDYPVDHFLIAIKRKIMREDVSNAVDVRQKKGRSKAVALPRPEKNYLAVHRVNNSLYYKRLSKEGYCILNALKKGISVQEACVKAGRIGPEEIKKYFQGWMSLGWFCLY